MKNHFSLLALASCGLLAASVVGAAESASPARPNVVFILADDLGQRDLESYGSTFYQTPQLTRLAAQGVRFTDAYSASPVCSPTRASLLTGQYPARVGITDWLPGRKPKSDDALTTPALAPHLAEKALTFAEVFHAAGYRTAAIGKWHLGEKPEDGPQQHGFDVNIGGSGHGHPPSYFSPYKLPNLADGPPGENLDDRLTREAIGFIRASADEHRPFMLYLAHYAVHTPLQARPEAIARYREKLAHLPPGEDIDKDSPDGPVRVRQTHPTYAAMIESLDTNVGTLLRALDELGLRENTLVVFTSDNGGLSTTEGSPTSNLPFRTGKGWAYEGGVRIPLIVSWPGHLPAAAVSTDTVTTPDFFPTLLELAGLAAPAGATLDGRSFAPTLREPTRAAAERTIFWHYPHYSNQRGLPHGALRQGRWKFIEWFEDDSVELFDLSTDVEEQHDVAAAHPELVAGFRRQLQAWRESVGAKMPVPKSTPAAKP